MANEIPEGYTELAQVGLAYGGIWNNDDYFDRNIFVDHNGDLWLCLQANSGNEPVAGSDYWHILVSRDEATEERIGMVRLSSRTDIEKIDGLALPATEKNPLIAGTLAYSIDQISDNSVDKIDLDTVIETGVYYCVACIGAPSNDGYGYLYVKRHPNSEKYVSQVFIDGKNDIYKRVKDANVWSDWECLLDKSDITRSTSVTVEGQKVLDATEKNPSIPGTLANSIGQINSDLAKLNNSLTDSFVISGLTFHVEYSIGNDLFNIWANGNTNAGINASSWTSAHTLKGNMVAKMQEKNQPYRFGIMQIHTYRGITSIRWYINSSGSVAYYVISGEIYSNENVQASVVF